MEPPVRRLRPAQLALVVVVVVGAIAVGDRLDGPPTDRRTTDASSSPSLTPSATSAAPVPKQPELSGLTTPENAALSRCTPGAAALPHCGAAPRLRDVSRWFGTRGGRPVRLADLRGRVVLLDFFAYSCNACRRDQEFVTRWQQHYRGSGLRVVGVQTPHWDFEADAGNVRAAVHDLGIPYPVGLDADRHTYDAYRSRVWPAKYLIDATGTVRAISFGAGNYDQIETQIRALLREARPRQPLPARTFLLARPDPNAAVAAEIGLGYAQPAAPYVERPATLVRDRSARYSGAPHVPPGRAALSGTWTVGPQTITAGRKARLFVGIAASRANVVVAGRGRIAVREPGRPTRTIVVDGRPGPVTLVSDHADYGTPIVLEVSPGVRLYAVDVH